MQTPAIPRGLASGQAPVRRAQSPARTCARQSATGTRRAARHAPLPCQGAVDRKGRGGFYPPRPLSACRAFDARSAMPAELLRLPLRALAELDVDQRRAREVHRLVERAAQVLRILNVGAVAAE